MKTQFWGMCLIGISLAFVGCVDKKETPSDSSGEVPVTSVRENDILPPAEIVSQLMTAIIHGNNGTVRSLLTPQARHKVEEKGTPFTFSASKMASFTIEKTMAQGVLGAYVYTTLTDQNEKGEKESAEIVWIVTKTEEGWRIGAAAVALFEGQEKTIINFEDPEAAQNAIATAENRQRK